MTLRFNGWMAGAFVFLALGLGPSGSSCGCRDSYAPANEMQTSSAVFTGTVTDIEPRFKRPPGFVRWLQAVWYRIFPDSPGAMEFYYGDYVRDDLNVRFEVHDAWKGVTTGEATVVMREPCLFQFRPGVEYLVYAVGGSQLEATACSRTRVAAGAVDDMAFLGPLPALHFPAVYSPISRVRYVFGGALLIGALAAAEWLLRRRRQKAGLTGGTPTQST
ncbi:MAG TPA: hypothetical protein VFY29_10800 [Terriglobia bacterium]|nr:hypothetical protein [Terriglobia bacterium]